MIESRGCERCILVWVECGSLCLRFHLCLNSETARWYQFIKTCFLGSIHVMPRLRRMFRGLYFQDFCLLAGTYA
jgi:hypothetical protein